jgi:hypothetical protein
LVFTGVTVVFLTDAQRFRWAAATRARPFAELIEEAVEFSPAPPSPGSFLEK